MRKTLFAAIGQLLFCLGLHAQEEGHVHFVCGEAIHGRDIRHYNIKDNCEKSTHLLITSYEEDGEMGTIISGEIRADNIIIEPGYSRVVLAPIMEFTDYHKQHKKSTTAGGNGNAGSRSHEVYDISMTTNDESSEELLIYPNPIVDLLQIKANNALKIIGYDLISADGKTLKQEIISATKNISFSTVDLKPGIYFIHVQLEDGEVFHKTILKQ